MPCPPAAQFYIASPAGARRAASRLASVEKTLFDWCYLGGNLVNRDRLARTMPAGTRIEIGDDLNLIAETSRQPVLDWIAHLGAKQREPLRWWASAIASKDNLQSDFFHLVIYYQLFASWVKEANGDRTRLVVVEDPWLRFILAKRLARPGSEPVVRVIGNQLLSLSRAVTYEVARVPLAAAYGFVRNCWRKVVATACLQGSQRRARATRGDPDVLICSFVLPESFSDSGSFRDIYWGRLEDILRRANKSVLRLTPPSVSAGVIPQMRTESEWFVPAMLDATLLDIARAAMPLFCIDDWLSAEVLLNADFRWLLLRERLRESARPQLGDIRLVYFAMRRVARRHAATLGCVLFPYEGQRWEKMLCLAFRQHAPRVQLVGYLHAEPGPLMLSLGVGEGERAVLPLPDRIATYSTLMLELLRRCGLPEEQTCNAGALRFEHVRHAAGGGIQSSVRRADERCVLVALPGLVPQARALLARLVELFPSPDVDAGDHRRLRFVLKCHPVLPLERMGWNPGRLPPWFEVATSRSLPVLLKVADAFVCAPPTTTRWEAYFAGLAVVNYRDDMLDTAELNGPEADPIVITSGEALRECILEAVNRRLTTAQSAQRRAALLDRVFSPVDEALWLELVGRRGPMPVLRQ